MLKKISKWISSFVSEKRNEKTDSTKIVCMFTLSELKHIRNACNITSDIKEYLSTYPNYLTNTSRNIEEIIKSHEIKK